MSYEFEIYFYSNSLENININNIDKQLYPQIYEKLKKESVYKYSNGKLVCSDQYMNFLDKILTNEMGSINSDFINKVVNNLYNKYYNSYRSTKPEKTLEQLFIENLESIKENLHNISEKDRKKLNDIHEILINYLKGNNINKNKTLELKKNINENIKESLKQMIYLSKNLGLFQAKFTTLNTEETLEYDVLNLLVNLNSLCRGINTAAIFKVSKEKYSIFRSRKSPTILDLKFINLTKLLMLRDSYLNSLNQTQKNNFLKYKHIEVNKNNKLIEILVNKTMYNQLSNIITIERRKKQIGSGLINTIKEHYTDILMLFSPIAFPVGAVLFGIYLILLLVGNIFFNIESNILNNILKRGGGNNYKIYNNNKTNQYIYYSFALYAIEQRIVTNKLNNTPVEVNKMSELLLEMISNNDE